MLRRGNWMLPADRLLLAFIALSITSGLAGGVMQLLLPLYAISLSLSAAQVGLIRGLAQFGGLVTTLPGGFLIDHYGARRVYVVACLLDAALICLIPRATTLPLLTGCLFLEAAIGQLRWTTVNSAFFSNLGLFGYGRAGWARASLGIGANFIGPLLGGMLAQSVSYSVSYAVVAFVVAAPALVIPLYRGELGRVDPVGPAGGTLSGQFRGLLGNRLLWRISILQAVSISSNSAYLIYIVLLVVHALGGTPGLASRLIAAQGVAFVSIMLLGGRLLQRHPLWRLYGVSFLAQTAGLLACALLNRPWQLGIGAVAFGLGSGMLTTVNFSRLGAMPGTKGKLSGLFFLVTGAGVALGPLLSGLLTQLYGIRAAFLGFLPLIAVAFVYVMARPSKRYALGAEPAAS